MGRLRIDYEKAWCMYENGLSLPKIADYFNTCHSVIGRGLKRRGHVLRPVGLHTGEGNQAKGKECNLYRHGKAYPRKAKQLLDTAIRNGTIKRKSRCEECGTKDKRIEAHHDDYTKPLQVRWLCTTCHRQWHQYNEAVR